MKCMPGFRNISENAAVVSVLSDTDTYQVYEYWYYLMILLIFLLMNSPIQNKFYDEPEEYCVGR